jgi:peptidoglycan hydrolase CwlO-like protein
MSEDLTKDLPSSAGEKLTQILSTVQRLDSRVQRLDSTVERLDSRLGSLEQTVEVHLYDTRPIWEKVSADIAELQAGQHRHTEGQQRLEEGQQRFEEGQQRLEERQQRLEEGQESLRGESREIRTLLRDIFRRLSIFNDTLVAMQADYRDIYDRVREIERQR